MRFLAFLLIVLPFASSAAEVEAASFDPWTIGVSGQMMLPQGGTPRRHAGGGAVRVGRYLTENWALEGEVACLEDMVGLAAGALGHLQGWDLYGDLFGYSRFDPFVTVGVRGWIGKEGQVGPKAGVGAFYHLTDAWALRVEADATLGLDSRVQVDYTISAGVSYSF